MPSSDARLIKSVVKSAVRGGPAKLGLDANPSAKDTRLLDLELRRLNRPTAVEARRRDGTTISSCDTNGHRKGARDRPPDEHRDAADTHVAGMTPAGRAPMATMC